MHRGTLYAAYGFLAFSGTLHFVIDVVSQYVRGKRVPGPETTLYYGLNTAYALGQVGFAALALMLIIQRSDVIDTWSAFTISCVAACCWLAFAFTFIEYREPRFNAGLFLVLLLASRVTAFLP